MHAAGAFDRGAQRPGDRPGLVEQRQHQKLRQRRVAGDVVEKRRHHRGAGVAVDRRRSQRCKPMGPAFEYRELDPVAARRHSEREQADETPRRVGGPHQDRLDIAAQHGRRGEREAGLVEDVRLGGTPGEPMPRLDAVGERRERTPFGDKGLHGRQHVILLPGRPR